MTRKPRALERRIVALAQECSDGTCAVAGCVSATVLSLPEARRAVEAIEPGVAWLEVTPGYWVARRPAPSA
jgi:hypothetical protein